MSSQDNIESAPNEEANGPQRESKLELFGFDSLVNILGLKRYAIHCSSLLLYLLCCYYRASTVATHTHKTYINTLTHA